MVVIILMVMDMMMMPMITHGDVVYKDIMITMTVMLQSESVIIIGITLQQ